MPISSWPTQNELSVCVFLWVNMCMSVYVCVCVCVCERERDRIVWKGDLRIWP